MKIFYFTIVLLLSLVVAGCSHSAQTDEKFPAPAGNNGYIVSDYSDTHKIPYDTTLKFEGAAGVERQFDVRSSPCYLSYDFYSMASNSHLTLLKHFKTTQQTTEVTCGPACVLMVLEHFGRRGVHNDIELSALRNTSRDTTYLRDMLRMFDAVGGFQYESTYNYTDVSTIPVDLFLNYLKRGIPVIVGTREWGGHWQIVIGYDTMGTTNMADDVLILAEPYDTTDHNQDGYLTYSFQRLFYGAWHTTFDPDYKWGLFVAAWPKDGK